MKPQLAGCCAGGYLLRLGIYPTCSVDIIVLFAGDVSAVTDAMQEVASLAAFSSSPSLVNKTNDLLTTLPAVMNSKDPAAMASSLNAADKVSDAGSAALSGKAGSALLDIVDAFVSANTAGAGASDDQVRGLIGSMFVLSQQLTDKCCYRLCSARLHLCGTVGANRQHKSTAAACYWLADPPLQVRLASMVCNGLGWFSNTAASAFSLIVGEPRFLYLLLSNLQIFLLKSELHKT